VTRRFSEADVTRDDWGRFSEHGGGGADAWAQALSDRIGQVKERNRAGYKPGGWREVTYDEEIATMAADMYRGGLEANPDYDKEELKRLCLDFAREQLPPSAHPVTLVNGPGKIHSRDPRVGPEELQRVADQVDDMHARFPAPGRMMIGVFGDDFNMSHPDADGQTVHGEAFIQVKARVWGSNKTSADGFMPAQDDHDRWEYVLAHEWGHAIDNASPLDQMLAQFDDHVHGLSAYGESSPREAYAEAFAEWYLTKGHTSNAAATFYANKFGWGEPW
jgi:hypothetical protein